MGPFYGYGYWDPFWGPYSWGPNRFYGYPYNYNMFGYNRYNRAYYQDDFSYRENSNISYNKGRRGSANNVVVYSDGKSSRSNNDENKNSNNVNVNRSYLGPSAVQYNGRNVKNFDIIVERGDGSKDKVRNYATKPGNPTVNQGNSDESPRVYLNRGSSNAVYGSGTLNNYNRINNNSNSSDQKRYYNNPQYNNNNSSNWRISGRNYANPSMRADGSRSNSNSVRSYGNPSSNSNSSINSYSSSINNSSSNISRSSSNSISSPSRGSVSGGASISRGSSSSAGSVRGSR